MNDADGLYLTIAMLWFGVTIAFVMKWYGYRVTADLSMCLILFCFTALAVRHHAPIPQFTPSATAEDAQKTGFVIQAGDGFYHTPDCERLAGRHVIIYEQHRGERAPCIDCILPHRHRLEGDSKVLIAGQPPE